ncbi:MAG: hypothetical protein ACTS43_00405 [Candidatus Hodgkinia cicadicola]
MIFSTNASERDCALNVSRRTADKQVYQHTRIDWLPHCYAFRSHLTNGTSGAVVHRK